MTKEFTTREEHGKKIKKSFSSIKCSGIRCGLQKIATVQIQSYPNKGTEIADVTALLFCRRCKHRFHVKILDQGARNTDVYFNNTL